MLDFTWSAAGEEVAGSGEGLVSNSIVFVEERAPLRY